MRDWFIGFGVIIGGVLLMPLFITLKFPSGVAFVIGVLVSTYGFMFQMYATLSMKRSFEKEMAQVKRSHEELLARVKELSSEEAIQLLLRNDHK